MRRLRRRDRPFLELTGKIFEQQKNRGDDALGENPLGSYSFGERPIKEILEDDDVYVGIGHGCRYGIRHAKSKKLLKKPTLWFSTSPEICQELSLRCKGDHDHDMCMGGKVITESAGSYTPQIARAIHKGFIRTMKRKDPNRLCRLIEHVRVKITQKDHGLKWQPKTVKKVATQSVGAVDDGSSPMETGPSPSSADPSSGHQGSSQKFGSLGIQFDVPKGRWLAPGIKSTLRKLHANLGHPSVADLQRFLRAAGVEQEMLDAVEWIRCSACAQSARPRVHRTTRVPPTDVQFNDQLLVDCCQLKDVNGKGFWFLCVLDRATMYHTIDILDNHSPEVLIRSFDNIWKNSFGAPKEVTIDQERGFIGPGFSEALMQDGTLVSSTAGQAHWQHGKIERHIGILKDMVGRVIKSSQASGPEQFHLACRECARAKNP